MRTMTYVPRRADRQTDMQTDTGEIPCTVTNIKTLPATPTS